MNIVKTILVLFFIALGNVSFASEILPADKVTSENFKQAKEICADKYSGQTYENFYFSTLNKRLGESFYSFEVFDNFLKNSCIGIVGFVEQKDFVLSKDYIINKTEKDFLELLKFFEIKHNFDVETQLTSN